MKFRCSRFPRLHVYGAGRFDGGILELTDEAAIARVLRVAHLYGIKAVGDDGPAPFHPRSGTVGEVNAYLEVATPGERARVLALEEKGRGRAHIVHGPWALRRDEPGDPPQPPADAQAEPTGDAPAGD